MKLKNIACALFMSMGTFTIFAMQRLVVQTPQFQEAYNYATPDEQRAISDTIGFIAAGFIDNKSHSLGDGLSEYAWYNGNRLYYCVHGLSVVFLYYAYKKNENKQQKHVAKAKTYMLDYLNSMFVGGLVTAKANSSSTQSNRIKNNYKR